MMLSTIIGVSITIILCATVASATIEPYIQRAVISDDIRARVAAMSLEEKVGQTLQLDIQAFMKNPSVSLDVDTDKLGKFFDQYRMGSILNAPSSGGPVAGQATPDAAGWRQIITQVQQVATTRGSKIPVLYGLDTVHGANYIAGAALFPHQLGLAATFNRTHAQLCGASGARDTRYVGIPWVFSPILDLASHQLWPRFMETFGEDPLLVSEMGRAIIEGYQGDGTASSVSRNDKVLACMKHFIGYPNPRNGADRGAVWTPDLHLRNLYVPSFQAAVDANVRTAMSAYHELNGQPIGISNKYLTQLLRNEMGFKGMMVTDYNVLTDIHDLHHAAADHTTATNLMFNRTSIDMIMLGGNGDVYFNAMVNLVKTGVVQESRLDQSVQLIMQMKKDTGLLDTTPGPFPPNIPNPVGSQQSYNEVMDSIRESVVLLKNSGGVLPLPLTEAQRTSTSSQVWSAPVRRVLVTGPSSNSLPFQTGGWTIHWQGADKDSDFQLTGQATLLQGIQKIAGSRGVTVDYQSGCNIDGSYTQAQMDAAVAAARQADVIIVAIGEKAYAEAPGNIDNLDLPEGQRTLVTNLAATGVPIVTILFEGRPRILHAIPEQSKAVIHAILPGPLAGVPIAEILFGITNPSGRLPFTYPSAINQIPLNYWHTASMANTVAQWNFGTGLSYSTFEYTNLRLSASTITFGQPVQVTVTVTNRGPMWGREAVLMFLSDDFRTIAPEAKLLKGFTKIYLQNGQQTDVTFVIKPRDMQFYGLDDTKLTQEAGTFTVAIDKLSAQFTLNV